ncbi:MAG: NAD(P)H-quinone oxidoreductase [Thermoanaerobaculia bacterium]
MRAIVIENPGDHSTLRLTEVPPPLLGPNDVRIRVAATAVNRADLLQRRGLYPPPRGASEILGLECAGTVIERGAAATRWRDGARVMALLPGGGYAGEAVVDEGSVMAVPESMTFEEAAAFPETFLTAFLNIFVIGGIDRGNAILVHGGASGVGTSAIALAREAGVRTIVTVGSDARALRCRELGADLAINYHAEDFVPRATEFSRGGVDLVLDHIGGPYLDRNLGALRTGGRLVIIGTMGGRKGELDFGKLLAKRITIIGSTLRARHPSEKAKIVSQFLERFGEPLRAGRLRPVIDTVLPIEQVEEAHRRIAGDHVGKIVLRMTDGEA